jgi:hypothetical protein
MVVRWHLVISARDLFHLFIEFIYSGHRIQKYIMVTHYKKQIDNFTGGGEWVWVQVEMS